MSRQDEASGIPPSSELGEGAGILGSGATMKGTALR